MSHARAASDRSSASTDDDAPLSTLGEQLAAKQRDAGARLRGLVQEAFDQTVQRVHEARREVERVITFGYGLEDLASLEASLLESEDEDVAVEPKRQRLEYVEETNDPLAGL